MKKTVLWLFSLAIAAGASAGEKVVAFWDFEKGLDSGNYRMAKRGEAAIVDDAEQGKVLAPGVNRAKAGGLILASRAIPELQVAGPFELSMKLKYTAPEKLPQRTEFLYLWDSRYTKTGGLTLILRRSNTNKLVFSISLGNGNKVSTIIADAPANFADGKWHELKILLTAEGKLTMAMDGKTFRTGIIPATPLPATQRLAIGDRVGSSYGTFTGLIDDVKLTAL